MNVNIFTHACVFGVCVVCVCNEETKAVMTLTNRGLYSTADCSRSVLQTHSHLHFLSQEQDR